MKLWLKVIFLLIPIGIVAAQTVPADGTMPMDFINEQGGNGTGNVTRVHLKEERTTIPESDVEEAINLDHGRYTPMNFQYYNDQNMFRTEKPPIPPKNIDGCVVQYMKCMLSLNMHQMICVFNNGEAEHQGKGIHTYNNYCDMYYDNCIHTFRYWRFIDVGYCYTDEKEQKHWFDIKQP